MKPYKIKGIDIILPAEPFYVGRGCGNRYKGHLNQLNEHKANPYKSNKIKSIQKLGFEPIIKIVSNNLTLQEADDQERFLIKVIGRLNKRSGTLTNLTVGGTGGFTGRTMTPELRKKLAKKQTGKKYSDESKKKMSEAKRGTTLSKEQRQKISKSSKGRIISEETKRKISESNKGRSVSGHQREIYRNIFSKPILQFTNDGFFIKEYPSCKSAILETGLTGITPAINNKSRHSGNFIWIRKADFTDELLKQKVIDFHKKIEPLNISGFNNIKIRKSVIQFTKGGTLVRVWDSIIDAKREIKSNISQAANGNRMSAGGFIWIYESDFSEDILKEKIEKIANYKPVVFGKIDYVIRKK